MILTQFGVCSQYDTHIQKVNRMLILCEEGEIKTFTDTMFNMEFEPRNGKIFQATL